MFAALLVAALTSASPSPLPIIITTKSSPICQALRDKIAPAIVRAFYEDQLMARQRPIGHDPQHGATISSLALNWIKLDELLNPDTFFVSDNPADKAHMESLREKLQNVADDENNALNILSGAYYTEAFEGLMGSGGAIVSRPDSQADLTPDKVPEIASEYGPLEVTFLQRQALTQHDELSIAPALRPLIAQCGAPRPSPSASR